MGIFKFPMRRYTYFHAASVRCDLVQREATLLCQMGGCALRHGNKIHWLSHARYEANVIERGLPDFYSPYLSCRASSRESLVHSNIHAFGQIVGRHNAQT